MCDHVSLQGLGTSPRTCRAPPQRAAQALCTLPSAPGGQDTRQRQGPAGL